MFIFNKVKLISVAMMSLVASTTFAVETTWDFTTNSGTNYGSGNYDGNNLSFSKNGVSLGITAWSDTWEVTGEDRIETATAARNEWGLLTYNRNSDEHYVDNNNDTDMLLLAFDDVVSLTSIDLGAYSNDSDISIAAFTSVPVLNGSRWSTVASNALFTANYSNIGTSIYTMSNMLSGVLVEAKYWLIGAYNSAFGNEGWEGAADYIKIAGITTNTKVTSNTTPPTDVPEPSALAIFAGAGLMLLWRRRQKM